MNFFPTRHTPMIYAYSDIRFPGCLKVGYTTKTAEERVKEQFPVKLPKQSWKIRLEETAIRDDGSLFTDTDLHRLLKAKKIKNIEGEWFECTVNDVKAGLLEIKTGKVNKENRSQNFSLRPEQQEAILKTKNYFDSFDREKEEGTLNVSKVPRFLWNAKMRFGKTFTAYQLAKKMEWKKILVLTFKPAVENAWEEDLNNHIDFEGWEFVSRRTENIQEIVEKKNGRPLVCFGSFQDYLGRNTKTGGIKTKNEWVHATNWDCVIFDEYHFGA